MGGMCRLVASIASVVSLKMVIGNDQASGYLDLDRRRKREDTKELIFTSWKNLGD
jgi:hypothetical protein